MSDIPIVLPPWVISQDKKEPFSKICFWLMKELHLSYADIMEMPVPMIMALLEELKEYAKKQDSEMKKAQRKK